MKIHIRLSGFFLTLLFCSSCHQQLPQSYEEELGVITNPRLYHEMMRDHPDKRMVDLECFISGIELDMRYATRNNFTNQKIYTKPKAYLRKSAAEALQKIQLELNKEGLGLKIFDAYRPYSATLKFYDIYPDTNFVAAPWNGSSHNRGCAVDLTLININTGQELEMPTAFDDFTEKAAHNFMDLSAQAIQNRQILRDVMTKNGFSIYPYEWWHYDFIGWEDYCLMDIDFEDFDNF